MKISRLVTNKCQADGWGLLQYWQDLTYLKNLWYLGKYCIWNAREITHCQRNGSGENQIDLGKYGIWNMLGQIIACHNVVVLNDKTWKIQMRVHNSCIVYGCIVKKIAWSWFFQHKYWPLCLLLWCFPGFITISSVTMITPVFLLVLKTMELWLLLTAFCHASGTVRNCSYFSVFVCPTCFISIYFVALFYFMLFCCFILVLFYFDLLCFVSSQ